MTETLVVRLNPAEPGRGSWLLVDESGRRIAAPAEGPLTDAAPFAAGRRVVALAPAMDVLLTHVDLPVRGASRVQKALPFALEEQLAEDVEAMHFAAGRPLPDGSVAAAAVERGRVEDWLAELREAGLEPQVICSEAEGVPAVPNHLTWLLEEQRCIARSGVGVPVALETSDVDDALRFGPGFPDDGENGRHLAVFLAPGANDRHGARLQALRDELTSVELRVLQEGLLPHLAAGVMAREPVNLLQGVYAPRTSVEKLWRPWRLAASLVGVLFLVLVLQEGLRLMILKSEERRLDVAVAEAFESAMPNARMVDPRAQVERRLAAVRGTGGAANESFLAALETLGSALAATPNAELKAISYRPGTLDLRLLVPSVETLEQIRQAVSSEGRFSATIQQANPGSDGVEGHIQVAAGAGA